MYEDDVIIVEVACENDLIIVDNNCASTSYVPITHWKWSNCDTIVEDINPHLVYTLSEHKSSTVAEFGIALLWI